MDKKMLLTRVILIGFCLGNLLVGTAGLIGGDFAAKVFAVYYGAHFEMTPAAAYIIRMLGAYVVVFGILGGIAAVNPVKQNMIINGIILLVALRAVQRFLFSSQILAAFGISQSRNMTQACFFLVIAAALFLLRPKAAKV